MASLTWEKTYFKSLSEKTKGYIESRPYFSTVTHIDLIRRRVDTKIMKVDYKFEYLLNFDFTDRESILRSFNNLKTDNWIGYFIDILSEQNSSKYTEMNKNQMSDQYGNTLYSDMPSSLTDKLIFMQEKEGDGLEIEGQRLMVGVWEE